MNHARDTIPLLLGRHALGDDVTIDLDTRSRHLHLIGQTGTGKSNLLLSMIGQDLECDRGVALLDPHGDLAEAAVSLMPSRRAHHLVYFDPSDAERPIGFNVLDGVSEETAPLATDNLVSAFVHVWGKDAIGPRSQQVLRNSLRALMDTPGSTLVGLPRLLTDEHYRSVVTRRVRDPVVAAYWRNQFANYDHRFAAEVTAPLLNKLDAILGNPLFRNIVGQPKSTIDINHVINEERVIIVNLAKGKIGEGVSHLLGAFLMSLIAQAALARASLPMRSRRPFYAYVDEFQSFATSSFALVLSEARKYRLCLVLGHQYLGQLDTLADAVLGNAGSTIVFRASSEDTQRLGRHLSIDATATLSSNANFQAWARLLKDGIPTEPVPLRPMPPTASVGDKAARLIENSRNRFGRDRAEVADRIEQFLRYTPPPARR